MFSLQQLGLFLVNNPRNYPLDPSYSYFPCTTVSSFQVARNHLDYILDTVHFSTVFFSDLLAEEYSAPCLSPFDATVLKTVINVSFELLAFKHIHK